jgi:hypothetical protein
MLYQISKNYLFAPVWYTRTDDALPALIFSLKLIETS